MRLLELIEGSDGKLDEQSALSIIFGLTLVGLKIYGVIVLHEAFDALSFAGACSAFLGGSLGMLTVRSRYSKDNQNVADPNSKPSCG